MTPTIKHVSEINISGISIRTSNPDEIGSTARIPKLWEKFINDNVSAKVRNLVNPKITYGVYTNYESDFNGEYNLIAGLEVSSYQGNAEWRNLIIPAGDYLMFHGKGKMPDVVHKTWKDVWNYFSGNSKYKRKYKTDFEKYVGGDEVEIYISIL